MDVNYGAGNLGGNPDTDIAILTNYDLAWDRKLDFINDGFFRSAIFYNETKEVKALYGIVAGANRAGDNIGDSESYGVELALSGAFDEHFDWGVGYIYQKTTDDLSYTITNNSFVTPKEFEEGNPTHHMNVKLGYSNGPWEADALAYYVSDSKQFRTTGGGATFTFEDVDSYVGLNTRVAYTFDDDLTLALSGQQLQDSEQQTSTTPDVERRVFLSLSKKF